MSFRPVSTVYLTDSYDILSQRALERHEQREAKAVIIYLRPVDYEGLPLTKLPLLPTDSIPVQDARWYSGNSAFDDAIRNLEQMIRQSPD
jgi:hypothetical protein